MAYFGGILIFLGWLFVALAFVSGLGFGIYALGVLNMTFGAAAWTGFVVWMKCFFGGIASFIIGGILLVNAK
jgi:hypothetical protein